MGLKNELKKIEEELFKGEKLNPRLKNKKLIDIKGRNAFRVAIIRERKSGKDGKKSDEYYITVDDANQFKQDYQNGKYSFSKANDIMKIKITDKSKEKVMEKIEEVLKLSNEKLMKKFNITDLGNPFLPVALLVDDTVQEYFESEEEWDSEGEFIDNNEKNRYWYDYRSIVRDYNCVSVQQAYKRDACDLIISKKSNGETERTDWLKYWIEEGKLKIEVIEISSELGEQILQMLQEKFKVELIKEKEEYEDKQSAKIPNVDSVQGTFDPHKGLFSTCTKEGVFTYEDLRRYIECVESLSGKIPNVDSVQGTFDPHKGLFSTCMKEGVCTYEDLRRFIECARNLSGNSKGNNEDKEY